MSLERERIGDDPTESIALVYFAWLIGGWVLAWSLLRALEPRLELLGTDSGAFVYWLVMKLVVWVAPALWLLRRWRARHGQAQGPAAAWTRALIWGLGGGVALAAVNVVGGASTSARPEMTFAFINAVLVAPVVEELAFRGVILRGLLPRMGFVRANSLTAVLFVGVHIPGWLFQGRLVAMASAPVGGMLSILVLGWFLGFLAHRSNTLGAPIIVHALNNLAAQTLV